MSIPLQPGPEGGARGYGPHFWSWFGQSKVVDDLGNPLVVYHGTGADIGAVFRRGTYFTPRPEVAAIYATAPTRQVAGAGPNVVPVYLALENPYLFDELTAGEGLSRHVMGRRAPLAAVWAELEARGHDGVVLQNYLDLGGRQSQFIAFHPDQVKFAIGI